MSTSRSERLESAGLQLLWDAVAAAERPVLLQAGDPASEALLRLARRAFHPAEPPFPMVTPAELAAGQPEHDLLIDAVTEPERRVAPVWHLVHAPEGRDATARISPLAGWSAADVAAYLGPAAGAGPALHWHTAGGSRAGKTALAALVTGLRRKPAERSFAVTDVPGTEGDPRGILSAASHADLSVVVIDAQEGLTTTARRDIVLLSSLGVRQLVLAVNKIDLVELDRVAFARVEVEFRRFAAGLKLPQVACLPVSATRGDNVLARSAATPWYDGPTLLELLDAAPVDDTRLLDQPLRMQVEWVLPGGEHDFAGGVGKGFGKGFVGTIVAGRLRPGDAVRVQPSGRLGRVARLNSQGGDLPDACAGQSIAVAFAEPIDVARGDLVVTADAPAEIADQFEATVVWLSPAPLLRGRNYIIRLGAQQATGSIAPLKHKIDVNSLGRLAAATLAMNEIGVGQVHLDRDVAFDPYQVNHDTGGFIVIDRLTSETVGVGMLHFALRRAQNVHWQALEVNKTARAALKQQRACVLWYTGLSGAGKSTIANLVDKKLHSLNRHTYLLDGDNVRHGLNKDLGFTDVDRVENIRRIGEVAKLMVDAGLIVSTAFISPFRAERLMARALVADGEFLEIFIDTPITVAELRDPKGLYKKARRGDLKNFTGIDSPYESPENPELRIDTTRATPEQAAEAIVTFLQTRGILA